MKKKINLLIADDDRFIRRSISRMLVRAEMFQIYEAENRDTVLDAVEKDNIDCILMDFYMADITGLELMRIFNERKINLPVIMLTGQGDEELAIKIMKAGAVDYISKIRLSEQDFPSTLTSMIASAVTHQEEKDENDRALIALELSEARYRGLIENSPVLIVRFFPDEYMISFINDSFCRYFSVERFTILGENILQLIPKSNHDSFTRYVQGINPEKPVAKFELKTISESGVMWQLWTVQGIFSSADEIAEYQCMGEDITDMKRTEQKLIDQRRYLQSILDSQDNMIIVADRKHIHEVNIRFLQFFGFYSKDDMASNYDRIIQMTVEMEDYMKPEEASNMWLGNISTTSADGLYKMIAFRHDDSERIRYFSVKFRPLSIDPDIFVVEFSDVTPIEERSKEFENRAYYDVLTKIYNRRRFLELLDGAIKTSHQLNQGLSIIFFDIDHFKNINDTYGHKTGDDVLKELASLVSAAIRHSDVFGRWGGEEFLILLEKTELENAAKAAEKIRRAIMEHEFPEVKQLTCSFGVTSYSQDDSAESFINRADSALYRAKESGRNRVIGIKKKV